MAALPGQNAAVRTLLAVSLTRSNPPLEEQIAAAVAAGADAVELRVDCIDDIAVVERILRSKDAVPIILTIRSADEGGQWDGSDADRVALLERLGLLNPGLVDVELALWRRSANLRQKIGLVCDVGSPGFSSTPDRPRNRLILSHHNWRETPADLASLIDELTALPGVIGKAAFRAADATDALRVLAELRGRPNRSLIAIAMGEAGVISRVLAPKFGGFLSFASPRSDDAAAPGQISIEEMLTRYRWKAIQPSTGVYGVVGWPVTHSKSPHIHNAAMAAHEIDGVYVPLPVGPDYPAFARFMDFVATNPWLEIRGLSVTIPHKEHALRWLTEHGAPVSPIAKRAGAVNTLSLDSGKWNGENTDGSGAVAAILTAGVANLRGLRVAMLGAGGAGRAIAAALAHEGCDVTIHNRDAARGAAVAAELGCQAADWGQRTAFHADLIVNGTSLGMTPYENESPLPAQALQPPTIVFDTVYTPPETLLLRNARAAGCTTISGVDLFIEQAARQYALWHKRPAPLDVFRAALDAAQLR